MADQPDPQQYLRSQLASTWPDPPPFWKDFTTENIEAFQKLKTAAGEGGEQGKTEDGTVRRIPNVPEQLINLQPPAEPADGKWRVFGDLYSLDDKLPTLEEQGMRRLTSTTTSAISPGPEPTPTSEHLDRAFQLKRLAKSLLLNFLEFLGILSIDPKQTSQKIEALRTLFINFHHVLNEYRPHQARESLIALMQDRLDKTRAETAAVRAAVDRARREIEGLASITIADRDEDRKREPWDEDEEGDARSREVDTWREVDATF